MSNAAESPTPSARRCPVCHARRRSSRACGRCGADLDELQRLELAAWRRCGEGWRRLSEGHAAAAAQLARESLTIADSRSARRLAWLAALLGDRATRAT